MDFDNPLIFGAWMVVCFVFVAGGLYLLYTRIYPRVGCALVDRMHRDGYAKEAVMKALQSSLMPAGLKRSLLAYAETVYARTEQRN